MTNKKTVLRPITCDAFDSWLRQHPDLVKKWLSESGLSVRKFQELSANPDSFLRTHVQKEHLNSLEKIYREYQYKDWLRTNPIKRLSPAEKEQLDDEIRNQIINELGNTGSIDISEYMLLHKYEEVKNFVRKTDPKEIEEVRNLIWKPIGRSDFRRIEPELILTSDSIDIKKTDFWGEDHYQTYTTNDKFIRHWNILRVLISSSRHDGTIGRQLRYLVRDKKTKTYLGIICISSSMMNLSERNAEVFGGDIKESEYAKTKFKDAFTVGGRSVHMANGQTIIGCQPFSRFFNGGKLLALLCISKQVVDDWEKRYGDRLVTVETTSLYGDKDVTQYEGLKPFWRTLGKSSGNTPIKPTTDLWKKMRRWLKRRYPTVYHHYTLEKNMKGMQSVRDRKNATISRVYQLLGIKEKLKTSSGHQRGIYLSKLYTNADLFLQGVISEDELKPAFDNSVDTLLEFWKYGFHGDTKKGSLHPELQKLVDNKTVTNKVKHSTKNSPAKRRLNTLITKSKEKGESLYVELDTDWYEPMARLSWSEVKDRFRHHVAR